MSQDQDEKLLDRSVTYTLEFEGKFYIFENVPAREDWDDRKYSNNLN